MIEPPGTSWPPKTFTPRRCAFESRPFLELPNPFLCAIRHLHQNVADLHLGEGLAMSNGLLILLLALEFEHQNLVATAGAYDSRLHGAAGYHLAALFERRLDGEFNFRADIARELFHADHV